MKQIPQIPTSWLIVGGVAAAALLYVKANGAKNTGKAIGGGVVDLATGIVSGVAEPVTNGAGSVMDATTNNGFGTAVQEALGVFGVPKTNKAQCAAATAAGDTWGVSKYCSAGDFIHYLWK